MVAQDRRSEGPVAKVNEKSLASFREVWHIGNIHIIFTSPKNRYEDLGGPHLNRLGRS